MGKKIFMPKNSRSGNRSVAKLLLGAALGLMVLVLIAPFLIPNKDGGRDAQNKSGAEKGKLVKEIPRPLELMQQEGSPGEPQGSTGGTGGSTASEVSPEKVAQSEKLAQPEKTAQVPEGPGGTGAGESPVQPSQTAPGWVDIPQKPPAETAAPVLHPPSSAPTSKESTAQTVNVPTGGTVNRVKIESRAPTTAKAADPSQGSSRPSSPAATAGSSGSSAKLAAARVQLPTPSVPAKTPAVTPPQAAVSKPPSSADAQAPACPPGKTQFSVQLGSYKDKQNAEEVQQALKNKGYKVVLKPTNHPKLGQLYVVQLQPVGDMGRASTLLEQVKHEEKVKPVIVKIPE